MFGKRSGTETDSRATKPAGTLELSAGPPAAVSREVTPPVVSSPPISPAKPAAPAPTIDARRSDNYYQVKATIFGALIEAIDLAQLAKLDGEFANRSTTYAATGTVRVNW